MEWGINLNYRKKNSLHRKIIFYLSLFSISILAFLWLFQVIFLDSYYEWFKKREMTHISEKILKSDEDFMSLLNDLSIEHGVCIEMMEEDKLVYSTDMMSKACVSSPESNYNKASFLNGEKSQEVYTFINPRFHNKTLMYGLKLSDTSYLFITTSLDPIDSTIVILKNQLLIVTGIVLLLSFVIAYFISRKIARPIEKINESAKELSKGNYHVEFLPQEDMKEIQELSDTLNEACRELAKTEEVRRDLLANVSHDLKTPLTMIRCYAEKVRDITYREKGKREEDLNVIIEEVDRLNGLVNDILSLSKMESKLDSLNMSTFSLNELVTSIIHRYQIFSITQDYRFVFEQEKDYVITADRQKIEQVLYNLINNAINYTGEDKTVWIVITEHKTDILVEIKDSGSGISNEDLIYIWDKYYRSEKKHKRNTVGTGLGLSIVKNILNLHHYDFGVKSKKQKGTTFYFKIPKEK